MKFLNPQKEQMGFIKQNENQKPYTNQFHKTFIESAFFSTNNESKRYFI